jgi:SAM-dependent methyltransferase
MNLYKNYYLWKSKINKKETWIKKILIILYFNLLKAKIFNPKILNYIKHVKHNQPVLDLGCGQGRLLEILSAAGYKNLTGIDFTIPEKNKFNKSIKFIKGDIIRFLDKSDPKKYQCIFAFDLIEHFSLFECSQLLAKIKRVLTSKGLLLLRVPNGDSLFALRNIYGDLTHKTTFNRNSITQLLLEKNINIVNIFEEKRPIFPITVVFAQIVSLIVELVLKIAAYGYGIKKMAIAPNIIIIANKP